MKIENRKLYNRNRFMSIFKPNKLLRSLLQVLPMLLLSLLLLCYAYYIRGLCSFLFSECKINQSTISHCNQMLPVTHTHEKCELKTTFYDETAQRTLNMYIYTQKSCVIACHILLALLLDNEPFLHIHSEFKLFVFIFKNKNTIHVKPYAQ